MASSIRDLGVPLKVGPPVPSLPRNWGIRPPPGLELILQGQEPQWESELYSRVGSTCGAVSTSTASSEHEGITPSSGSSDYLDSGESICEASDLQALSSRHPTLSDFAEPGSTGGTGGCDDAQKIQQPTVHSHGPQRSLGSELHDQGGCIPCAFYCFKKQGCGKGVDCNFCHMPHTSNKKLRQQEWRKKQHTQSRKHRRASRIADDVRSHEGHGRFDVNDLSGLGAPEKPDSYAPSLDCCWSLERTAVQMPLVTSLDTGLGKPCFLEVSESGCLHFAFSA